MATKLLQQTETQVRIPVPVLKALAAVAPKHDVRFYLVGVNVEVKGNVLSAVATNGYSLAWWETQSPMADCQFFVPVETIDMLVKHSGDTAVLKRKQAVTFEQVPDTEQFSAGLQFQSNVMRVKFAAVEKYPDWRRAVAASKAGDQVTVADTIAVSIEEIARLQKVSKMLGIASYARTPKLGFNGAGKGIDIDFQCEFGVQGIVMPVRI